MVATGKGIEPPKGMKILHGFKSTERLVPINYDFDVWYKYECIVLRGDKDSVLQAGASSIYDCPFAIV